MVMRFKERNLLRCIDGFFFQKLEKFKYDGLTFLKELQRCYNFKMEWWKGENGEAVCIENQTRNALLPQTDKMQCAQNYS